MDLLPPDCFRFSHMWALFATPDNISPSNLSDFDKQTVIKLYNATMWLDVGPFCPHVFRLVTWNLTKSEALKLYFDFTKWVVLPAENWPESDFVLPRTLQQILLEILCCLNFLRIPQDCWKGLQSQVIQVWFSLNCYIP